MGVAPLCNAGGIDAWGSGVIVTVSSASPMAPELFPLVSCGTPAAPGLYAVGCLAVGFLPPELTWSWSDSANRSVGEGAAAFPPTPAGGLYTASSRLSLPLEQGKAQQPFSCAAAHPRGTRRRDVSNPGPSAHVTPVVTLHPPSREDFEGPYRNSSLLCQIRGPRQPPAAIRWLKNGTPLREGVTTETSVADGRAAYVTDSRVVVTEAEWDAGAVYTCQVEEEMRNTSKALECGYDRPIGSGEIVVRVVPPLFADIFQEKVAKLTCVVDNLPSADGLVISWWKENGQELETRTLPPLLQPNALFGARGVASVCADDWDKGEVYTCRVTHPELVFPAEAKLQKVTDGTAKAPSIYVFPPTSDQLSSHEAATITCLVQGFNPPDLFVRWLRDGEPLPPAAYVTLPPTPQPGTPPSFLTYSALRVTGADWGSGSVFTCLVGHERIPLQVAQRSVDRTSALLEGFAEAEEEDLNNLWATASTFIVLFILSLFYSATVTLIKVK